MLLKSCRIYFFLLRDNLHAHGNSSEKTPSIIHAIVSDDARRNHYLESSEYDVEMRAICARQSGLNAAMSLLAILTNITPVGEVDNPARDGIFQR